MDDFAIVELFHQRDEQAITESDKKYGSLCRSIALRLLRLRKALRTFLESEGVEL